MKRWIVLLAAWYALLGAGFLVVRDVDSSGASQPSQVDWEMAAVCVWERWDESASFEQTASVLRFCLLVEPHSLPPSQSPETRG